jgi:hypothetical protein
MCVSNLYSLYFAINNVRQNTASVHKCPSQNVLCFCHKLLSVILQFHMMNFRVSLKASVKNTNSSVIFRVSSVTFLKYWGTEFHYNTQCISKDESVILGGADGLLYN